MDINTNDTTYEWARAIQAMMWLRYNHSTRTVLLLAYGTIEGKHPDYIEFKSRRWDACPLSFFAELDTNNRRRFVEGLLRMYGDRQMECALCEDLLYDYGHNALPVAPGRACDACNQSTVIPARLQEAEGNRSGS